MVHKELALTKPFGDDEVSKYWQISKKELLGKMKQHLGQLHKDPSPEKILSK